MLGFNAKRAILWRVAVFRQCVGSFWNRVLACWIGKSVRYRQLQPPPVVIPPSLSSISVPPSAYPARESELTQDPSDLVALKISLLGDCQIGKTSFLTTYVGREKEAGLEATGLNQMGKTLCVSGARIAYSIWEVEGNDNSQNNNLPVACKDSVAMLFMFDLTSRCTLNSVIGWYKEARKWNQSAIPVLVGTKFDDFVQLPIDLQWTIASQARTYAKALNATLFFSSSTYNINVNKIFKFITAKLFNLPWSVERNLTIGEPIIDF